MSFFNNINYHLSNWSFALPTLTFSSILDILCITVFCYYILLWIRNTRAYTLLKGLVTLFCFYLVAYLLNLYTVTWVISNTINVGLVAIFVLFQPEIRKALEQIGTSGPLALADTNTEATTSLRIDEVMTACSAMKKQKCGALIVIEKLTPLGDYVNTGIPIDGLVTSQLLVNIFEDKTPLHDGAVIIKNGRILAASCILPLTSQRIASELGTRHRAGVGLSEVTDAYVIIVSEETGALSLAHNGKLMRDLSEDDILLKLKFNADIRNKKRKKKRNFIKKGQ